jgi:hypothetical protein
LQITDTYTYSFDLGSIQATAISITGASLSLTHHGNSNTGVGEVWLSTTASGHLIGQLSESNGPNYITDSWILSSLILNEIMGSNPWTLTVKLDDNTTGTDKIEIRSSTLSANYSSNEITSAAVPEPASLILLGSSLLFTAAGLRKRAG